MAKELEYFKDFLDNPGSYKVKEFYEYLHEWGDYIAEHKDEFNYLEDEEWREIKDRVLEALIFKEDLREEFEEIEEKLDSIEELEEDAERIAVYEEWLAFMKKYQDQYGFTDEQIAQSEKRLGKIIISVLDCEVAHERLKRSNKEYQKSLDEMDDSLFEHYKRTGKRPVLSALQFKYSKRIKGN